MAVAATKITVSDATVTLRDLKVGDTVTVLRNLDHPTWVRRARQTKVLEVIGQSQVLELRAVPGVAGIPTKRGSTRPATTVARLTNDIWYDLADGFQDNSGVTRIVSSL